MQKTWRLLTGGLVIFALIACGGSSGGGGDDSGGGTGAPALSISSPGEGATVDRTVSISGTSANTGGLEIWILVYARSVRLYYPQYPHPIPNSSGKWSATIFVGGDGDGGQSFEIAAMLANASGQQALDDYVNLSLQRGSWDGLRQVPAGVTDYHRITVTRR